MAHQIKQRHLRVVGVFVVPEQLCDDRQSSAGRESLGVHASWLRTTTARIAIVPGRTNSTAKLAARRCVRHRVGGPSRRGRIGAGWSSALLGECVIEAPTTKIAQSRLQCRRSRPRRFESLPRRGTIAGSRRSPRMAPGLAVLPVVAVVEQRDELVRRQF